MASPCGWNGELPPAVAYTYAPGRGGPHGAKLLDGFKGVLQVDGAVYPGLRAGAVYKTVARVADAKAAAADAATPATSDITLAFCWAHLRRKFYELYAGGHQAEGLSSTRAPIATEALARIQQLYAIEKDIRGQPAEARRRVRQDKAKPIVDALKPWVQANHGRVSKGGKLGGALAYGLNHWDGSSRYLVMLEACLARWPHRDRFQHGRARHARHRAQPQERAVRRPRPNA